jgi:transmembrane sensor
VLTLADGRKISLNDAANGRLASQTDILISKHADGQLVYSQEAPGHSGFVEKSGNDVAYNSIETPRGGQYRVTLPDGSRVWLNSASSIRFPATFSNLKSRDIQLKGEAYFEVTRMRAPFTVTTKNQVVRVLGTHFNINSYEDEQYLKTVLLEGSVSVSAAQGKGGTVTLKPGQQANLGKGIFNVTNADIEKTMAWKNGYFSFNDQNIQSIMKELSRWYNVEVSYEGAIPTEGFYAKISRSNNISRVLNALQSTKAIHFKLEGRRIIVTE